ncbi:3-hydroxyacyl-CoA dehydrogenase family protein [Ancylobacter polymorphus]|uniref:3-hydroxyacyl-CoA dehydrogenase family protein n=1 Tax=Ancylobacter polymorphus TaxID=223390 RepID=A0A9E7CX12_9HYPH|nr:3-hydroxyacyl-CoA dehydrogenase family protein [Ancylobacter polymorphus]UOK73313.1 3-hydroxyacyl-CoA dehydrogenase family protein [Ancylobacter polymorphus]
MRKVGVIGAGTMGFGIAIVASRGGFETVICDTDKAKLRKVAADASAFFEKSVKIKKMSEEAAGAAMGRLSTTTDIRELYDCDLVIEAVFESFTVKAELLATLGANCRPETVLASNTSTLSITQLAATTGRPENFVGLHFCLPAQVMKLVEVTPGLQTSGEALAQAWAFCESAGQIPIKTKDTPGFILNYFVIPFNLAAVRLVEEGVADAPSIDRAIKTGLGHALGPLELVDMVGIDTQILLCEAFYVSTHDPRMVAPHLLHQMAAANQLGRKTGRGFYDYSSTKAFGA